MKTILRKDGCRWLELAIDLLAVWLSFIFSYILVLKHQGVRIRSLDELNMKPLERVGGAQELVMAIDNSSPERLKNITSKREMLPIKIKIIPNSAALMEDRVVTQQIRTLKNKTVGLRLGERIFEEFLANDENTEKTRREKIMIAKVNTSDLQEKRKQIDDLCQLVQRANPERHRMQIVASIKAIVPEFKSQNSIFESLDPLEEPLN